MYTILRLEEDGLVTYLMILTDDTCSVYDFLTYDSRRSLFVDENFSYDSFMGRSCESSRLKVMIEKIGRMIEEVGLHDLMYDHITEYDGMYVEYVHVPENYTFKFNEIF